MLDNEAKRRRGIWYPRVSVKHFLYSSFRHLYLIHNNQALLNCTGYDHPTFTVLVRTFHPYYDYYAFDEETGMIRPKILCQDGTPYGRAWGMCA